MSLWSPDLLGNAASYGDLGKGSSVCVPGLEVQEVLGWPQYGFGDPDSEWTGCGHSETGQCTWRHLLLLAGFEQPGVKTAL